MRGGRRLLSALPRRACTATLLLLVGGQAGGPLLADPGAPLDDFGRWRTDLVDCSLEALPAADPARTAGCGELQLEQQAAGLLSVRFLGSGEGLIPPQLTFAGVLESGSRPMACRQGQCQPHWPLRLRVHAVAAKGLGGDGAGPLLPRARLARGHCLLGPREVSCQAGGAEGTRWRASARS